MTTTCEVSCPPPAASPERMLGADAALSLGSARAALWWARVPPVSGQRPGLVGRFAAGTQEDALALLAHAARILAERGCSVAIGPMDGDTWHSYRFVTWRGDHPRFALEPDQPDDWPRWWSAAGFAPHDEYWSACVEDLQAVDPRLEAARDRLEQDGVLVRPLALEDLDAELKRIHQVSTAAFTRNVLYTPLAEDAFLGMYQPIGPLLKPGLSHLAEHRGRPVGFIFAIPDIEQAKRGAMVDTMVVKTLAHVPGKEYAGLGKLLLERCQRGAHALGMRRAIHALMHAANSSRSLGVGAREIRRYTLFARALA
jgi:hypothetical protein